MSKSTVLNQDQTKHWFSNVIIKVKLFWYHTSTKNSLLTSEINNQIKLRDAIAADLNILYYMYLQKFGSLDVQLS